MDPLMTLRFSLINYISQIFALQHPSRMGSENMKGERICYPEYCLGDLAECLLHPNLIYLCGQGA
jgi:hypothetical protein